MLLLRPHNHSLFALLILSPDFSGGDLSESLPLQKTDIEAGNVNQSQAEQADLQLGCIQSMFMAMKCTAEHSAYVALLIALALAVMDGSGDYGVVAFLLKRGFPVSAFLVLGTECLAAGVVIGKPKPVKL